MQRSAFRRIRPLAALAVASSLGVFACLGEEDVPDGYESIENELTLAIQGESMSWTTSSGDSISASSSNARLQANASGDTFSFNTPVVAGTYAVVVKFAKRNIYGNYRLEVNGAQVGSLAGYASGSSDSWSTVTLGNVAISGGSPTFRFVSTGKDSASSDYDIKVDYIELRSTSSSPTPTSTGTSPPPPGTPPPPPSGTVSCAIPAANGQQSVSSTIKVSGTLDGGLRRYVGSGALGSGSQDEDQGPLFELANGATLRNVIIGAPAADGVHCRGTCTLENVYWEDVGEDAATQKGSSSSQVMTINGGVARSASDKVFQHNGPGTMVIKNFCAENFGKLYRSCGNCSTQHKRAVTFDNIIARGGKGIAGINTNYGDTARFTRVTVNNSAVICEKFRGVTSGEPTRVGRGADGTNCIYSSSDIIKQ